MSDDNTGLLRLLLRQTSSNAHLQSRLRLPFFFEIFRRQTERAGHGLESRDEYAIVEALEHRQYTQKWTHMEMG